MQSKKRDMSPPNPFDESYEPRTKRKSTAGRKLMRWDADVDQHVLLCIDYVCARDGIYMPWDEVAKQVQPWLTGEAIKQHMQKVRVAREIAGRPIPDKVDKTQRRKTSVAANAGQAGASGAAKAKAGTLGDASVERRKPGGTLLAPSREKKYKPRTPKVSGAGSRVSKSTTKKGEDKQEDATNQGGNATYPPKKRGRKSKLLVNDADDSDGDFVFEETPTKKPRLRPLKGKSYAEIANSVGGSDDEKMGPLLVDEVEDPFNIDEDTETPTLKVESDGFDNFLKNYHREPNAMTLPSSSSSGIDISYQTLAPADYYTAPATTNYQSPYSLPGEDVLRSRLASDTGDHQSYTYGSGSSMHYLDHRLTWSAPQGTSAEPRVYDQFGLAQLDSALSLDTVMDEMAMPQSMEPPPLYPQSYGPASSQYTVPDQSLGCLVSSPAEYVHGSGSVNVSGPCDSAGSSLPTTIPSYDSVNPGALKADPFVGCEEFVDFEQMDDF